MKNILKIILSIIFISLPSPIFSQSTKVYEYWLDKFLLPRLKDKFNNHKIIDEIDIPFINIHKEVFEKEKNPLTLFPFEMPGHYNAEGYKKVSEVLYQISK